MLSYNYYAQCAVQPSLEAFFDGINSNPVKLGVVGCGCSVASEPVAAIVHQWNIPQVRVHGMYDYYYTTRVNAQ